MNVGGKLLIGINPRRAEDDVVSELRSIYPNVEQVVGDIIPDYEVVANDNESGLSVGIIRKTVESYVGSILNQILQTELYQLSTMYTYPILIIEGYLQEAFNNPNITRSALLKNLTSCIVKASPADQQSRISVIMLETPTDIAEFISGFVKDLIEEPIRIPYKPKGSDLSQLALFMALPGVGEIKAKKLIEQFKDFQTLCTMSGETIGNINGIGKKLGEKIYTFLHPQIKKDWF